MFKTEQEWYDYLATLERKAEIFKDGLWFFDSEEGPVMSVMSERISKVKQLRKETGAGLLLASRALEDANGDYPTALAQCQRTMSEERDGEKELPAGKIVSYIHGGRIGVLLEVRCATDFTANTEEFRKLCDQIALHIAADPQVGTPLYEQAWIRDTSKTIGQLVNEFSAKCKEGINVSRYTRYEIPAQFKPV